MSTGGLFSFRPELGETPEVLERRRKVAEAMLASAVGQPATTIGGGLSALGQAIGGRLALGRVNRATAAGQAGAADVFSKLFGGGGGAAAPGETAAVPGTEPVSTGGTAAVADALADGTSSAPVATVDLSGDKAAFVAALMPAAIEASKVTGVDPRIIVAQAAQETGWGRSAPGNNYFGIKSHGKGGGQTFTTHEVINGKRVKIQDSFRRFASPGESVAGYAQFLRDNPRYKAFMAARGLDAQLAALGKSGYATDPNYAASVGAIARGLPMPAGGGGVPAVTAALAGTEPIASADPTALAAAGAIDPAAKDDLYQPAAPAAAGMPLPYDPLSSANPGTPAPFRPAGGPTPYNPLGADQTWQAGSPSPPLPPMRPAEAPVAPPVAPAAPAASAVAPVAQALGVDPLPQTSGLMGPVASAGHESLSPGARAVSGVLAGGAGTDALAGGGGGLLRRLFGGGGGGPPAAAAAATPAAVAPGGGGGVPSAAVPGETAALPGTEPVSGVPPTAGGFSPRAQAAIAAMSHPFASESQKEVAGAILKQELEQLDPKYRAELAKIKYDLDVARAKDPVDLAKAKLDYEQALNPQNVPPTQAEAAQIERSRAQTDLDKQQQDLARQRLEFDIKQGGLTSDIKNYEYYERRELAAGRKPLDPLAYEQVIRAAGAATTTIDQRAETAGTAEMAKLNAKKYDDLQTQASAAQDMLDLYDVAEIGLQAGGYTGFGAEALQGAQRLAVGLGLYSEDEVGAVAGNELLTSIQNRMALMTRNPESGLGMPGAVSDKDISFLKAANIGIDRTPEGNRVMLEVGRRMEQRKIEVANLYDLWLDGEVDGKPHSIDERGFGKVMRQWAKDNPLFDDLKAGTAPAEDTGPAPEGVDPEDWKYMTPEQRELFQ